MRAPADLGIRLCARFGIDPNKVSHIQFNLAAGDIPTVTFTLPVVGEDADVIVEEFATYELRERAT